MSLILDALRKLERDKGSYEPGVLVVGSVPWGETSRARRLAVWAGAALVLALAVLVGWLLRRSPGAPPAAPHPASATAPEPAPVPSVAAPTPETPTPLPAAQAPEAYVAPPIRLSQPPAAPTPAAQSKPSPASAAEPAPEPAQPAAVPSRPESDEPRLTAISQRDGKPVALINDRLLFEGDSVDGIRVIRIGEAEVEIEVKGQRRVLRF